MKRIISLMLALAALFTLAACSKKEEKSDNTEPETADVTSGTVGGWEIPASPEVTDKEKALLDKALEKLVGATYTPVACLGEQVVAGTNHALLCRTAPVVPNAQETYTVVILYEDLQGGAEITDVKNFDAEANLNAVPGGWSQPASPVLTEEVKKAFDKALEGFTGVNYEPVALVSEQVVAGMNYCVACRSTVVYPGAESTYSLVYIYADLQGGAEITDIVTLEQEESSSGMGIGNPFVDYETLADAAKAAGFELKAPESLEGYDEHIVQVMNGKMIQEIFRSGEDRLLIRKQAGAEDISGDYGTYDNIRDVKAGDLTVNFRGNGNSVNTAIWTKDGYSFAVMSDKAMTEQAMKDLIAEIA